MKKLVILALSALALQACTSDGDVASKKAVQPDDFDGFYIDRSVKEALEVARESNDETAICSALEDDFTNFSIIKFEGKDISQCELKRDWKKSCENLGTINGRVAKMLNENETQKTELTLVKPDPETINITELKVDGKVIPSEEIEGELSFKKINEKDVDDLISGIESCESSVQQDEREQQNSSEQTENTEQQNSTEKIEDTEQQESTESSVQE